MEKPANSFWRDYKSWVNNNCYNVTEQHSEQKSAGNYNWIAGVESVESIDTGSHT